MFKSSVSVLINRVFLAVVCVMFTAFLVMPSAAALPDGLVGHWALDGDTSDGTGNNPDGTIIGVPTWTEGRFDQALSFVGPGDNVDLGTLNPSEGTDQFSFGLWTDWAGNNGAYQLIFSKRWYEWADDKVMWSFYLHKDDNTLLMLSPASGNVFAIPMIEGEWIHLAVTFDGTDAKLYVDGEEKASGAFKMSTGTDSPLVLSGTVEQLEGYSGIIDNVFLYNRALDPGEVQELADGATLTDVLGPSAISSAGKLATRWAQIKSR